MVQKQSVDRDTPAGDPSTPLSPEGLRLIDAYWRAANYLSVGQIYLLDNPLLREPLRPEHVKPRLLGHWGTTPGLNFIYAHLNRVIRDRDLDAIYITGPGHGGPGLVANAYLEGTYSEVYPSITRGRGRDAPAVPPVLVPGRDPEPRRAGDARLDPRGRRARLRARPTPTAPRSTTRTSSSAASSATARPRPGPLAASWHSNKFLNPRPTARSCRSSTSTATRSPTRRSSRGSPRRSCVALLEGYGYHPYFVAGDDPAARPPAMAAALDACSTRSREIQQARPRGRRRPSARRWPMIVLRTPKGWTGPKEVDGQPVEGTLALAPGADRRRPRRTPAHLPLLEDWMRSYRPEELFDDGGAPRSRSSPRSRPRATGG